MLITQQIHDYYDGVAAQGIDKSIVYVRIPYVASVPGMPKQWTWRTDKTPADFDTFDNWCLTPLTKEIMSYGFNTSRLYQNRETRQLISRLEKVSLHSLSQIVFLVCGKVYVGYRLEHELGSGRPDEYFYSTEKLVDRLGLSTDKIQFYDTEIWKKYDLDPVAYFELKTQRIVDRVQRCDIDDLMRQTSTPIMCFDVRNLCVILNPCLKDYGFASCIDPFTMFQNLQMYHSTISGLVEPEMIQVSDEIKRDCHGFDEYSFKTRPQESKK